MAMQEPPPEFREEFVELRDQLERSLGEAETTEDRIAEARHTVALWRSFFGRWHETLQRFPEFGERLGELRGHVETLDRAIEALFVSELIEVVRARRSALAAEQLFRAMVPFIQAMTKLPDFRADVLAQLKADTGEETDPEKMFRQSESAAAEEEQHFRALLAQLREHWPERLEASTLERLQTADVEETKEWAEELGGRLAELQGDDWPPAVAETSE